LTGRTDKARAIAAASETSRVLRISDNRRHGLCGARQLRIAAARLADRAPGRRLSGGAHPEWENRTMTIAQEHFALAGLARRAIIIAPRGGRDSRA